METFQLKTTSRVHYAIFLIAGMAVSMLTLIALLPKDMNTYVLFGSVVVVFLIVFWLAGKYSKETVDLSISHDYFIIEWIKLPPFSNKSNWEIIWADIDTYVYQVERDFDVFKIRLKSGEKLKFSIAHDDNLEIFKAFYKTFLEKVKQLQETTGEKLSIKKGKTFYETPMGIALAFVLGAGMLVAVIYALYNQDKKPVKWGKVIAGIAACAFYIQLVWSHNRKESPPLVKNFDSEGS